MGSGCRRLLPGYVCRATSPSFMAGHRRGTIDPFCGFLLAVQLMNRKDGVMYEGRCTAISKVY